MQLEDVSPKHGGSSFQISTSHDEYVAAANQAAMLLTRLDAIDLAETTPSPNPHKSSRKETAIDTQSAKRRGSEVGRYTTNSGTSNFQHMRTKEAIPSIDIVSQMWLEFSIHEAVISQRDKGIIREHRTNEEFARLGTSTREVIDFKILWRVFPWDP